jgi:hypothetical protein
MSIDYSWAKRSLEKGTHFVLFLAWDFWVLGGALGVFWEV